MLDFNERYADLWNTPKDVLERGAAQPVWEIASHQLAEPSRFLTRREEIFHSTEASFDVLALQDGRIIECSSAMLTVDGESVGRLWNFRDITERNLADLASRRLAAIVASSDDGIIGKDLNSIVTSWNAGAERIFGYTAAEMIGSSIMRLIPEDRQEEESEILARIRRGERFDHFETIRIAKDGRPVNVSITVSPIKDSTGHIVGASKVARDITERKQIEVTLKKAFEGAEAANRDRVHLLESEREARSRAERASRMKDEFLATLSHELRTPLNAVLGWVNILKLEKSEGADLEEGLNIIERNARAQAQIIEDLLDMSRIISGKVRLDAQRVELAAVLNESIDTVRATAEAKGVELIAAVHPLSESIFGDPHRLQQVFWNLLNNAIKFTPRDGQVRVKLARINSHLEVSVADTGQGIDPGFLPIVFDRYQQADASPTRLHGGQGLGMQIVKHLVEMHGGKVSDQSEGLGRRRHLHCSASSCRRTRSADPRTGPRQRPGARDLRSSHRLCRRRACAGRGRRTGCARIYQTPPYSRWSDGYDREFGDGGNNEHRRPAARCPRLRYRHADRGRVFLDSKTARSQPGRWRDDAGDRIDSLCAIRRSDAGHPFRLSKSPGQTCGTGGTARDREQPGRWPAWSVLKRDARLQKHPPLEYPLSAALMAGQWLCFVGNYEFPTPKTPTWGAAGHRSGKPCRTTRTA